MLGAPMLSAGSTIASKYRLEEVLGKGATGTVWRAVQLELDRPVALKLLHAPIAANDDAHVRFSREARVAASLDHPSSVAVLDFGEDQGSLYLVMELVTGESLRARLLREPLSLAHAVAIVRQIATALAAAHKIRLVHRDIKPENVILPAGFPPPPAKVVDFGLAFIVDPDDPLRVGRVTLDGSVAGTPAYMSPEQVRGGSIGPASDIYSLGCLLYELIAGKPPFTGPVGEVLTRQAYAPPIPLRQLELEPAPPEAIDTLVQAMLSKSPSSRPTASRVVALLAPYESDDDARIGRTSAPLIERHERAVPRAQAPSADPLGASDGGFDLGVTELLSDELALAFATSGIRVHRWPAGEIGPERIVWADGASLQSLAALAAAGKAVVTDVAAGNAATLPALIHAGVADAIVRPHDPDDLVRRLFRVHRLGTAPR
jgi:serine/threonine-protein kinase